MAFVICNHEMIEIVSQQITWKRILDDYSISVMLTGIDIKKFTDQFWIRIKRDGTWFANQPFFFVFLSIQVSRAMKFFLQKIMERNRADRWGSKIKFFYFIRGKDPDAIPQGIRMELTIVKGAKGEMINDFRIIDKSWSIIPL